MSVIERHIQVGWPLRVFFTENVFAPDNLVLHNALKDAAPRKVLVILEDALSQALPELEQQIVNYFAVHASAARLVRPPLYVCGGESAKNSPTIITELQSHISKNHIDRHSYIIAVGGGALLDVAGFAAAIAHRGVRHVRIPTTTLSQADSGVGVKNGINAFGKKNFVGTFAPPYAVINDFNLLATLLSRFNVSHGEAVAIGIALDVIYSRNIGLLDAQSAGRILDLLTRLGFRLYADELLNADDANRLTVLTGLEEFREHLGGELTITLLTGIGRGVEVHEMDESKIIAAIHELKERAR
ncbi:MAG: hypothetical protein JF609_08040 [Verrucomicrobia bacterium]|nr:hypothetical protein [Verrucomicrobiota bacterium]